MGSFVNGSVVGGGGGITVTLTLRCESLPCEFVARHMYTPVFDVVTACKVYMASVDSIVLGASDLYH